MKMKCFLLVAMVIGVMSFPSAAAGSGASPDGESFVAGNNEFAFMMSTRRSSKGDLTTSLFHV
jgi:hypothetical protein